MVTSCWLMIDNCCCNNVTLHFVVLIFVSGKLVVVQNKQLKEYTI